MKIHTNKLQETIERLNWLLSFIEVNEHDAKLRERYIKVLRFQKALIRDIDRQGRKIPTNIPSICENTGIEVNSVREKEPPFTLSHELILGDNNPKLKILMTDAIQMNSYFYLLNNYSLKYIKKLLNRKLEFSDLNSIEDNLSLIMEIFKHKDYYSKFVKIKTFTSKIEQIKTVIHHIY